jgi:hypothetical protein
MYVPLASCERVTFCNSGHPALRPSGQLRCSRRSCGAVRAQEKVTKEKGTPQAARSAGSCPLTTRSGYGVRGLSIHGPQRTRAHRARAPSGRSSTRSPGRKGTPVEERRAPARRSDWRRRTGVRALRFRVPFGAGGRRTRRPAGARAGRARVRRDAGCIVVEPRPTSTHLPRSGRRCRRGVLSLGDFSLDKQREVTGPQGCGTNLQGCGQVFAKKSGLANTKKKDTAKAPAPYPLPQAR